jgi:MFS family permease
MHPRASEWLHTRLGRARLSVAATFALHAAATGTLGPRLPAIKRRADLSASALGAALVGFALGLFVGTRLAAWPLRRFGSRTVLRAGVPALALSLVGPAFARDLATLAAALFALGLVSGLIDVAMNANAVEVERGVGRPIMSGIHGAWSLGLLLASGAAAVAAALDASPPMHFAVAAAAIALSSVPILRDLLPGRAHSVPEAGRDGGRRRPGPGAVLRTAGVPAVGAIAFGSFLAEGSMNDWSAVYLRETLEASSGVAAVGFFGFAVGMTASRFAGDALSSRFGPVAVVRTGALVAATALTVGLAIPHAWAGVAGFTILGAALAPIVPIAFSAGGNLGTGADATELGWVVTIGYAGAIAGPALIGFATRWVGLRLALGIPAILALVVAALARNVAAAQRPAPAARRPPAEPF